MSATPAVRIHYLVKMIAASTVGIVLLSLFMVGVILPLRDAPLPTFEIDMPDYYKVGQTLPAHPPCLSSGYYPGKMVSCIEHNMDGMRYSVLYRDTDRVIVHAAVWNCNCNIKLGDLVLQWGQPTGIGYSTILWGNRSAFAFAKSGLSPFNKIYFISYDEKPEAQTNPWRGFTSP